MPLKSFLSLLGQGGRLDICQSKAAFDLILQGQCPDAQIAGLLMAMAARGETVDEITGGALSLRERAVSLSAPPETIDTCGTGGDPYGAINISTAVAFVVAGCGVPVAKHGNKSVSSKSGSSDVLTALGVNIDADTATCQHALETANICFLMAPKHHGAMKAVAPVRAALGTRTIFNLLGPLANPAGTRRQLLGVYDAKWVVPIAEVLQKLGCENAWVVHGHDGLDELTTTTSSTIAHLETGSIRTRTITPEQFGLPRASIEDLKGGTPAENAARMRDVFAGHPSPYRDVVVLNAAAALCVAGAADTLEDGLVLANRSILDGKARAALDQLITLSNSPAPSNGFAS
jgi:anthranilate phosphoribosyltransferase